MKAMLLCAGLGTRLRPMTHFIPKPLVPIPARPLAFAALDMLHAAGVQAVLVNLHHLPEQVRNTMGSEYRGMQIEYSHEPEILGPTGGIRKAIDFFGDGPFPVVNGDVYFDLDIKALMDFHTRHGAALTLAVKTDAPDSKLNSMGFDASQRVRQVWGRPDWRGDLSCGINIGAFVHEPRVIREYVPGGVSYGFGADFIPALFEAGEKIAAFPYQGYWSDIGSAESYLDFLRDVFDGAAPGLAAAHEVSPSAKVNADAKIVPPCHIAAGCEVGPGAVVGPYTVLCENAQIGAGAIISHSVVLPNVSVSENAQVSNTVVTPQEDVL